jgi:hypothetical protein
VSRRNALILGGIAAVVVAVVVTGAVLALVTSGTARVQRAQGLFRISNATRLAEEVDRDGPLFFPDPNRHQHVDIWVQHLGGNDWVALYAFPPGVDCRVQWQPATRDFSCGGHAYPPGGGDLVHFPATVDDKDRLVIDLRRSPKD